MTAELNDSTESLFTVFRGRLFQFRIVCGKKDCCLSCKRVGGIWYESECIFLQNLNGDMSMSVLGIATSSCEILYNMTRRPGVAHYYYFLKTIENYSFIGFFKLQNNCWGSKQMFCIYIVIFQLDVSWCQGYGHGVQRHFQQYFSYIVAVRFIGGWKKPEFPEKTTDLPQVTDKLFT